MKMKCLVLNTNAAYTKKTEQFIHKTEYLEFRGSVSTFSDAAAAIKNQSLDLLYLDINFLGMYGERFLKTFSSHNIIITVSDVEFAVEAFSLEMLTLLVQLDIVAYLVTPCTFEIFLKTSNKARDSYSKAISEKIMFNSGDPFFSICKPLSDEIFHNDLRHNQSITNLGSKQNNGYLDFCPNNKNTF